MEAVDHREAGMGTLLLLEEMSAHLGFSRQLQVRKLTSALSSLHWYDAQAEPYLCPSACGKGRLWRDAYKPSCVGRQYYGAGDQPEFGRSEAEPLCGGGGRSAA